MRPSGDIRVRGDRLWIRLETRAPDGTPVERMLVFERT